MEKLTKIPTVVAALIPISQLRMTKDSLESFTEAIEQLGKSLEKCPKIGETNNMEKHPAIFHYFFCSTDIFICEYDREDLLFGYNILNGDLQNSEWGYTSLSEITKIPQFNIDYHWEDQSIEAALYRSYPEYFEKPPSLMK